MRYETRRVIMLNFSLFERAIAWAASGPREAQLTRARASFEQQTGPIVSGSADYEGRIAHFFEHALCTGRDTGAVPPIAAFAAGARPNALERMELAGWLRSYRSLFCFERIDGPCARLHDRIGGARFRFRVAGPDRALRPGDCFDARLIPVGSELWLSPGRVFHPQAAQLAIETLLAEAAAGELLSGDLLDPLLRMRSRFVAFESIRAEHVYRLDAVHAQGAGAPWARAAKRTAGP